MEEGIWDTLPAAESIPMGDGWTGASWIGSREFAQVQMPPNCGIWWRHKLSRLAGHVIDSGVLPLHRDEHIRKEPMAKMTGSLYHLSAFTTRPDGGNPAGVWVGDVLPDPETMQRIAAEVGYSETAF